MIALTNDKVLSRSEGADRARQAHRKHLLVMCSGLQRPVHRQKNVWVNELYEGGREGEGWGECMGESFCVINLHKYLVCFEL